MIILMKRINSIQNNNNNDIQGCYEIIKTGIKKGKLCENTIFTPFYISNADFKLI